MPAIEEYLDARREVEVICAQVSRYKLALEETKWALDEPPAAARKQLPMTRYVTGDLEDLLNEAERAFDKMNTLYKQLPADQQPHVSGPIVNLKGESRTGDARLV